MQGNSYREANTLLCSYVFCYTEAKTQIPGAIWINICPLQMKRAH